MALMISPTLAGHGLDAQDLALGEVVLPGTMGTDFGVGATKQEAYDDAAKSIPMEAEKGYVGYEEQSDGTWKCTITWTKED